MPVAVDDDTSDVVASTRVEAITVAPFQDFPQKKVQDALPQNIVTVEEPATTNALCASKEEETPKDASTSSSFFKFKVPDLFGSGSSNKAKLSSTKVKLSNDGTLQSDTNNGSVLFVTDPSTGELIVVPM